MSLYRSLKQGLGRALIPRLPVTRHVFDHCRYELALFWVRLNSRFNPLERLRLRRLRRRTDLSVNIAPASTGLPGWFNLEGFRHNNVSVRWDCRRRLPFGDGSCVRIYCEHFFEHLDHAEEAPAFLRECCRVLAPGGTLRLVVPDAGRYLRAYASEGWEALAELGWKPPLSQGFRTKMDVINHVFRQGFEHHYAYDYPTLKCDLEAAGFPAVHHQSFRQSVDPHMEIDQDNHRPYSLYVDAVKAGVRREEERRECGPAVAAVEVCGRRGEEGWHLR
jgi:predicted SAM-dependent methyltransferase